MVGPKRVAEMVWSTEVAKWRPDLSVAVAAGPKPARLKALESGADVTAIGVANLADVKAGRFRTIVLDELSLFKNSSTSRWKSAKALTRFADHVWGLTGTPTPNGLLDLWAQMFLLDHGARLGAGKRYGTGITKFRDRWFYPTERYGQVVTGWALRDGAEEEIHEAIRDIVLSMRAIDHLDLPPVTYNSVPISLDEKVQQGYSRFKASLVAELPGGVVTAANAAVLTGKLAQYTAGFLYDDERVEWVHRAKLDAVQEIIDGTGSPVLVFHRFQAEREELLKIPGARTIDEKGVLEDWDAGRVPVLVCHPRSAGHGLNLYAGGHTVVWTSLDWSPELWKQANARLARQGQTKPVVVHTLEVPGSIDTRMAAALTGKMRVEDALMEALR